MAPFLTKLKVGGPAYRLERDPQGFSMTPVRGQEDRFTELAREVMSRSGDGFIAFARPDGQAGYDLVQVIEHEKVA
jgi:hypothetical protein